MWIGFSSIILQGIFVLSMEKYETAAIPHNKTSQILNNRTARDISSKRDSYETPDGPFVVDSVLFSNKDITDTTKEKRPKHNNLRNIKKIIINSGSILSAKNDSDTNMEAIKSRSLYKNKALLHGITPDMLKSSEISPYIFNATSFRSKKCLCRTSKFLQNITEPGCDTKRIKNHLCAGNCYSIYIPISPNNNITGNNKQNLGKPFYKSYSFCEPKTFKWINVTLNCSSIVSGKKRRVKQIKIIDKCGCIAKTS